MSSTPAPDLSIVLPTYREAASLPRLVPSLAETVEAAGLTCEIVVVDDASPDGTADVARHLAERWPLRLLSRHGERGLATAALFGLRAGRGEVCVLMDADGSHPVSAVPALAEVVRSGRADLAVGSRLTPGGGFRDWPLWGRMKSRFAAFFARELAPLSDPTTGLMAVRRSLLDDLDLDPVGWKIVLEIVVKSAPRPFVEVPIVFGPRLAGESKQSLRVFWQYLRHCARLAAYRRRREARARRMTETSS
ncbi:MAG: polyprenol monophosphomannose synthase [Acidobacteriota bacterium]